MNFKKTLGLVLTAALVSTSLVAVKPVKAAAPVVATAPTSINFKYFFPQRSLLVDGEADSYVVDTDYAGKVQYEFWVKSATDKNAKWQVVSADANGKPGYTAAVDGQNTPYAIPVVKDFTFKQGQYYTAVYVKAVGSEGKINYNHYMDATTGVDTQDAKTGTVQTCDTVKTGYFNAVSQNYKQKYKEMLDDFMFSQDSAAVGQTVTFKGFNSAPGAKLKLVVRKVGSDATTQTVVNPDAFKSSVDWAPKEAGTYQLIAWSAPYNAGKNADRDGWAISSKYYTVTDAPVQSKLTVTKVGDFNPFFGVEDVTVNDSSLVAKVLVNGTESKFTAPNATTVRLALDNEPTSIVLVDKDGNKVTAKGSDTPTPVTKTLSVTKVGDFNPFFGVQDITVNDSSLVAKVLVNGTESKFTAPNATTVRLALDNEATSIVFVDASGNQVTVK
jgi:hypothetical protein